MDFGASAPSEGLGTLQSNDTGAGTVGRVRPRARLASGPPRRVAIADADARAHHEDEATEAEAAEEEAEDEDDAADERELEPTESQPPGAAGGGWLFTAPT